MYLLNEESRPIVFGYYVGKVHLLCSFLHLEIFEAHFPPVGLFNGIETIHPCLMWNFSVNRTAKLLFCVEVPVLLKNIYQ
jgi:hypothetical protein